MTYQTGKLNLITQPPGVGPRYWDYEDTGSGVASMTGAGFFTDAYQKGARVGDRILLRDLTNTIQYEARFSVAQDTGSTQGTVVLDTG